MEKTGKPTIEQVAALAGVSRSTASRAINGGLRVSLTAQEAVNQAVERLGYFPNQAARSLVTRRTNAIGLIIFEPQDSFFSDPFFGRLVRGINSVLSGTQLQLTILLADSREDDAKLLNFLRSAHLDGAVVASHLLAADFEADLKKTGLPLVFVGRPNTVDEGCTFIDVDNLLGAKLAVSYLKKLGATRIGHIAGNQSKVAGFDRLAGFETACKQLKLAGMKVICADFSRSAGFSAMEKLWGAGEKPQAVFCASDQLALGAHDFLATLGKAVLDSVTIVGFDNSGFLPSVDNPVEKLAAYAVHQLMISLNLSNYDDSAKLGFEPEGRVVGPGFGFMLTPQLITEN